MLRRTVAPHRKGTEGTDGSAEGDVHIQGGTKGGCLECRKHNNPQKEMQNRFYRCINLDGVFEISSNIPSGPMLLIDDIFDSGWTFTVISSLLRKAGSGEVYPFAVASTSNN